MPDKAKQLLRSTKIGSSREKRAVPIIFVPQ